MEFLQVIFKVLFVLVFVAIFLGVVLAWRLANSKMSSFAERQAPGSHESDPDES